VVRRIFLRTISIFSRNDQGQDLAEYCLITAIITLIGMAIFFDMSGGLKNLWGTANTTINAASSSAGSVGVSGSGPVEHQ